MDVLTPAEQEEIVSGSALARLYNEEIDRESAYEILNGKIAAATEQPANKEQQEEATSNAASEITGTIKAIANSSLTKTVFREVTRGLMGVLLGTKSRSSSRRSNKSFF